MKKPLWIEIVHDLKPDRRWIAWTMVLLVVRSSMDVLAPWPIKVVFDSVLGRHGSSFKLHASHMDLLVAMAATMALASLIGMVAAYKAYQLLAQVNQSLTYRLRNRVLRHILKMPVGDVEQWASGELLARLMSDSQKVSNGFTQSTAQAFTALITMVGILIMVSVFMPLFSLLVVAGIAMLGFVIFYITLDIRRKTRIVRRFETRALALAMDHVKSLRTVFSLRLEPRFRREYRSLIGQSRDANEIAETQSMALGPVASGYGMLLAALALYAGGSKVLQGAMTPGDLVVLISYLRALIAPSRSLAKMAGKISISMASLERIHELTATPVRPPELPSQASTGKRVKALGIEIRNLRFTYPHQRSAILSGLNLDLPAGKRVAILGESGIGKSTLVSLLLGFFEPTSGTIRVGSKDIRHWSTKRLRWYMAWVNQDPHLFSTKVWENIASGHPKATRADAVRAVHDLGLEHLLDRLPQGIDTLVTEGGSHLSGGQRQTIALARAVLRDAPILLLDEPGSGLDPESQQTIMEALLRVVQGRTTLIITHQTVPLSLAEEYYVLSNGRLEYGGRVPSMAFRSDILRNHALRHSGSVEWNNERDSVGSS